MKSKLMNFWKYQNATTKSSTYYSTLKDLCDDQNLKINTVYSYMSRRGVDYYTKNEHVIWKVKVN